MERDPKTGLILPDHLVGPRKQRGSILLAAFAMNAGFALNATLTVGLMDPLWSTYVSKHSPYDEFQGWGYDGGSDYYAHSPNTGDLVGNTYKDGTGTTRTVSSVIYSEVDFELFSLDGTSIANNDSTFRGIIVNGVEYLRADAVYDANTNGGTHWWWDELVRPHGTSGDVPFQVFL